MIEQLKGKPWERGFFVTKYVKGRGRGFLDDVTVPEMEKALQVKIDIVKSSGYDFIDAVLGKTVCGKDMN